MTILVVEDDHKASSFLRQGLEEHGFSVTVADSAKEALHLAQQDSYEMIILDVGLPDQDGFALLPALRRGGHHQPVLFLTARDAVSDRVRGLELGAEDYLVKPFAFAELLARVRTVLRRSVKVTESLRFADVEVDLLRQRALRGGKRLDLSATEFALLAVLVRHAGEPLSRRDLAATVWDMHVESGTNVVDVTVRRLRVQIDEPFSSPLIHTVRGIGYVCRTA